jgi:hypothetical protein
VSKIVTRDHVNYERVITFRGTEEESTALFGQGSNARGDHCVAKIGVERKHTLNLGFVNRATLFTSL